MAEKYSLEDYETVEQRLIRLYTKFPSARVLTHLVHQDERRFIVRAEIYLDPKDQIPFATGYAEEIVGAGFVNKTSALENCETSAIGRCLASAGWGGAEFASANEVQNAIHQQLNPETYITYIKAIEEASNVEQLKTTFKSAFSALQRSPEAIALVNAAKDKRKLELSVA